MTPTFPPPVRPGRVIRGHAAVLLPFRADGSIDWPGFEAHIARTAAAGLTPAVNMDTGYVQLLDETTRAKVLDVCRSTIGPSFVAGAFVADGPGDRFDAAAHIRAAGEIADRGGTPVVFPSNGLSGLAEAEWVDALADIGAAVGPFLAFELGPMFVPYGRIYSLDTFDALLDVETCIGAKHSSLDRSAEWARLARRDAKRPTFCLLTGNDLAIDMVTYGSDYLLGLATFAPDHFARRDALWAAGDARFAMVNDLLQYLGQFAFRPPVPAYRHDAAMFLVLRGWAESELVPPEVATRPASDRAVLADILERLDASA
jgi:dihydrodipicolinate synthase/N-acetylneuraminate lyase